VIAEYYKSLPSLFNFPLSDKIMNSVANQRNLGICDFLEMEKEMFKENNSEFTDATFLRNHDQVRVRTSFGGSIDKSLLAGSIYLTLPGTPFIYYGEEIGMEGAKPDEYIREPYKWTDQMNSEEQTYWIKPKYNIPNNGISYATEKVDKNSIFNHYKLLLKLRKDYKALSLGEMKKINLNDKSLLAYLREMDNEKILVIHNLNRVENMISLNFTFKNILYSRNANIKDNKIILGPFSSIIIEVQ